MVTVGQLGKPRRFGDQHAHHFAAATILENMLIHIAELGAQQVGRRTLVGLQHAVHDVELRLGDLAHHRDKEVLFVLEVDVDGALGDAGALGDLIECGRGVAVAGKFDESGLQNFLRTLRLTAAPHFRARFQHFRH